MELRFLKIDGSHNAIEFEFASAEEHQQYSRALLDIPEGYVLSTLRGQSRTGRPTITVGKVKVGGSMKLEGGETTPKVVKAEPVPAALEVPRHVMEASDEQLETMAAKNGITDMASFRARNKSLRQAMVARALVKQNAR